MTERRPPPSLGNYRPPLDHAPEPRQADPDGLPRIITGPPRGRDGPPSQRPRTKGGRRPPPPPPDEGRSWLRIFLYTVLGLTGLLAAAAVAAFVLVPTELIRDRLQAEVKARTGSDLVIAGRTALTLWPRPAVSLKDVTLSSPPAMGAAPLIQVAEIEASVEILPLLLHEVAIDRLILRKPVIDLRIDASGRRTWDFAEAAPLFWPAKPIRLAQATTGNSKTLPKELQDFVRGSAEANGGERPPNNPPKSRIGDLTLGNVSILDGAVRYRDERSGLDEAISALNVKLSLAHIASPLDAKGDFVWRAEPVQVTAQMAPFRAVLDGKPVQTQITATSVPLALTFDGIATLAADLDLDGRVTAKAATLDRLARWTGRPLTGSLTGGLAIDAKFKQTSALTALNDARFTIGPITANGTLSIEQRSPRPFVKGQVRVATLDLNALQALAEAAPTIPAASAKPAAATPTFQPAPASIEDLLKEPPPAAARKPQVRGYTKRTGWSDEAINFAILGLADADVRLGFDKVIWQDLMTGAGQLGVALKAKSARVTLDDVQLYDGRARGIITLDATAPEATLGGNLVLEGVSALPFLTQLSGFDWLSGRTRVAIAVAGRGATERQIISTLNGKADIAITDGAIVGINIPGIVRNLAQGRFSGFDRTPTEKTDFSEFAASALITNGIARNDDLRLASPLMRATGAGTIDLPQRTMDYLLRPKMVGSLSGQGGATAQQAGLEIPLKITGSLDKPTVTPELGALLRDPNQALQAIQDAAKTPAGKEVQDTVKGLINGNPEARAKAKSFLDQLLKN